MKKIQEHSNMNVRRSVAPAADIRVNFARFLKDISSVSVVNRENFSRPVENVSFLV